MTKSNICFILNFAPHYRKEIYLLLEKDLGVTFYFADKTLAHNLKKLDYALFSKHPVELKFYRIFKNFNWISGSISLPYKTTYKNYVITGEPFCLSSWLLMMVARFSGKKVYTWTHGWNGGEQGMKKLIKRTYLKLSHGHFIYGNYAKNLMVENGFDANKLFVVYNSLHHSEQKIIRSKLSFSNIYLTTFGNSFPNICFIGRLNRQKRLGLLLEAQTICEKQFGIKFNIIFIGNGPDEKYLRDTTEKNRNAGSVCFFGACYNEEKLGELIYNADLCVSPGEVGLTAIHVLGYGTPVITHNNFVNQMPEFEAIENGITGYFFKEGDANDLALKINLWFKKFPSKTDDLVSDCFRVIDEKFNPSYQMKVFSEVLAGEIKV